MPFIFPNEIRKDTIIEDLNEYELSYWHNQLHIIWNKIETGTNISEWNFDNLYECHTKIIELMKKKNIKHITPINNLDNINTIMDPEQLKNHELIELQEKLFSVEKKMNGFHATAHKSDNELKIFSEQKKDLTSAFPTLVEAIKKLSSSDFIIDGELVPYDNKGNTLGRNTLMKYTGAIKSGSKPNDSNIKFHIWDIIYLDKPVNVLPLKDRINILSKLNFNDRVKEIERKIVNEKELENAINWASNLKGTEGAIVKDLSKPYIFGEASSWKKYRILTPVIVQVIKKVPKKRNLFNYLVGIKADRKFLDPRYINNGILVLGHTFNTKKSFEPGDKIKILVEEVWRHESSKGIHYSLHKPRVEDKSEENLSNINYLENIVVSIGTSVTQSYIDSHLVLKSDIIAELEDPSSGEKNIEVMNFPNRMQANFRKMIGKWGNYTMQVHTRGKTLHYDLRNEVPAGYLEGITLFGKSTSDRLPIESQRNNIRSTIKLPEPIAWINVNDITHKGSVGATKFWPGIFTIISKGKYTIIDVSDHVIKIAYKSDKGKIDKSSLEWAKKHNIPYASDLPDNLIDLSGEYSWHIAHIGDHYIVLFDKVKEQK